MVANQQLDLPDVASSYALCTVSGINANLLYVILNPLIFLSCQSDGDSGGKSKVRAKKPNSKYNEEISSDSETEGLVSDVALTWGYALIAGKLQSYPIKCTFVVICVLLLYSHVGPKKRQSNEEHMYEETPQEKKLRLAKLYLDQLKEEGKLAPYKREV